MQKTKWIKHASAIAIAIFVAAAVTAVLLLKHFFQGDDVKPKKMVQQITVITPPPPPPPPPQEPMKQPEVKEEQQIKEAETPPEQPQEQPAESESVQQDPNASGDGPVIAAGTGGGMGTGRGGGGYEQFIRHEINDWVVENQKLKRMDYIAMLTLQISTDGAIESCDVEIISGDSAAVDVLKKMFNEKRKFSKARPLEAAGLVKLRIKSVL